MKQPDHMVVEAQESVLVTDSSNGRVVLLSSSLTFIKELLPPDRRLEWPQSLCHDHSRGPRRLLYVGEWRIEKVLVFKV